MAKGNIIVGLDIGSANVRTVIGEHISSDELLRIIGVSVVPSVGMRRGAMIDIEEVAKAIHESLQEAEKMAGVPADQVVVSIGGPQIYIQSTKGVVAIGKADGEVIDEDVRRVIDAAQAISIPPNREIIHIVPKSFRLDDQGNIKDPVGMSGVRLEVDALIIEGASPHIKNINNCLQLVNVSYQDMVLSPLASAQAVLSKKQKELGVVVMNIGGGTTSLAVYEEGDLLHATVLPIGSGHVTNDIAIGIRTSIDVAERVKLEFGSALSREVNKKEEIDLSEFDSQEDGIVSRYHVAEIIEARLEEIFSLVHKELKSIGKSGLLPAGVVITGGGAKIPFIVDMAKEILGLPAQLGYPHRLNGILDRVDDPGFSTAVGLVLWGQERFADQGSGFGKNRVFDNLTKNTSKIMGRFKGWIDKFLP